MKYIKKLFAGMFLIMLGCLLCSGYAFAADKTLTVGDGNGIVGGNVSIPISVDDSTNVGGIAFTLTYDPVNIAFVGLSAAEKTMDDGSDYPDDKYTPEYVGDTLFFQFNNDDATGTVMIAAASAQDNLGNTLFNAVFEILSGDVDTIYPITIEASIINNPDAGYDGDTEIPILVGIPADTPDENGFYPTEIHNVTTENGSITVIDYIPGDVNGDGEITPQDAVDAFWLSFKTNWTADELCRADFNKDGEITPQDAVDIFWASF